MQVGVGLTPQQDHGAQAGIARILGEHFAGQFWRPRELHYGDVINSRGPYAGWSDIQKKAISDAAFDLLLELKPTLYGTVIDMQALCERYKTPYSPIELAMRATLDRMHGDLDREKRLAMVFVDEDRTKNDTVLRDMVLQARQSGIKLGGQHYNPTRDSKLERILNAVVPFPSHMSAGIQLADFVAYAVFSKFERNKSRRFEQLGGLWKAVGGWHEEPVVFPKG